MLEAFVPIEHLPKAVSSNRLTIRQYRVQEWEEYHSLYSASFAGHLEPWSPIPLEPLSEGEARKKAREHIMAALDKWDEGTDYRFFILLKSAGKIIGQLGITQVTRGVSQSAFIGYWVGKGFLNHGYATEAVVLGMEFAFECLRLHRISLWIAPENLASLRIAEKLGLRVEGVVERALFLGGRWQDTRVFSITSEEWDIRRNELLSAFTNVEG